MLIFDVSQNAEKMNYSATLIEFLFCRPAKNGMIANAHCTYWQVLQADTQAKTCQRVKFLRIHGFKKLPKFLFTGIILISKFNQNVVYLAKIVF